MITPESTNSKLLELFNYKTGLTNKDFNKEYKSNILMAYLAYNRSILTIALIVAGLMFVPGQATASNTAQNNVTADVATQTEIETGEGIVGVTKGDIIDIKLGTNALGSASATTANGEVGDLSFGIDFDKDANGKTERAQVTLKDYLLVRSNVKFDVTFQDERTGTDLTFNYVDTTGGGYSPSKSIYEFSIWANVNDSQYWSMDKLNSGRLHKDGSPQLFLEGVSSGNLGIPDPSRGLHTSFGMENVTDEGLPPGKYGLDILWTIKPH